MTNKFKTIKISINNKNLDKLDYLITIFNSKFKSNEIQLELNNDNVTVYLKQINFNKFKEECKNLSKKNNFFETLFTIINNIGSYGIRNGKRNYID